MKCIKRNGDIVDFDKNKITDAMRKAFNAEHLPVSDSTLDMLEAQVEGHFQGKVKDGGIRVEDIQDSVQHILCITPGFDHVGIAYALYRRKRQEVRDMEDNFCMSVIEDYTGESRNADPLSQNNNASQSLCWGGLLLHNSGDVVRNYWMSQIYDPEIREHFDNLDFYIHDNDYLTGYCAGWSLMQLIRDGIPSTGGKTACGPAKHLNVLCNQMVNFLGIMQNEWAGAQAFSSFDTYLAPFVKVDNLSYKEVKSAIQSFVFGVNMPSRWGCQAPFSNITLDWTVPNDLANMPCVVGGEELDFCYKDCKPEMDMINKAFLETMIEGDANGRGFAYPIPSYSITKDFDWSESENNRLLFEMTAKFGVPNFSNYVNSDMEPSDVRSMCCRLRLDLRELRKQNGGNFGAGENTGSIGVVTINIPRIAYLSKDDDEFRSRLRHLMDVAARSLDTKRRVLDKYMDMGLYPYTKYYLKQGFKNHFNTIGVVGFNEACLNAAWIGKDLTDATARKWAVDTLQYMKECLMDYQEKYGSLFNLEATPAESTAYKLARADRRKYPDIITAGGAMGDPYYTNSTHLPVGYTDDIFDALDMEDPMQVEYTSGTIFHAFLGERMPNWKSAMKLTRSIAQNYRLPYFTISPVYSICENHGYLAGEHYVCPECGQPSEVYSRITGYYRPVKNWNAGKVQEFRDRKYYKVVRRSSAVSAETAEAVEAVKAAGEAKQQAAEEASRAAAQSQAAGQAQTRAAAMAVSNPVVSRRVAADVRPVAGTQAKQDADASAKEIGNGLYLFTTKTCPNCRMVKERILPKGTYETVDAEENPELAKQFGIRMAPTLVVVKDGKVETYANASSIREYTNSVMLKTK
jgi:ribonucleoside-triphosphate reductase